MVSSNEILGGGLFTITDREGVQWCYRVTHSDKRGRLPEAWFVSLATEGEDFYVGKLDDFHGTIALTKNSKFVQEDEGFRVAFRVFKAIFNGQQDRMRAFGEDIRKGTPNDAYEETPAPVAETSCNRATVDVGEVVMVQYDIPEIKTNVNGVVESNPVYPNPSAILRKAGVRWTKSVWMFQESRTPWVLIDQMIAAGCTVDVVPVAEKATEQILKIAQQRLTAELKDGLVSLEESAKTAEANYQRNLDEGMGAEKAIVVYQRHMAAAAKRCEALSKDLEGVAKNFGVTLTREEIAAAIRSTMTKATDKAASYAKAAKQLEGTVYAQAAQDGDLPAAVMADILADMDKDASELVGCFDLETGAPIN